MVVAGEHGDCWWWLSFASEIGFLGVAIVQAGSFLAAVETARALGINPGGEVQGWDLPSDPPAAYQNRLLSKAMLKRMEQEEAPP